MAVNNRKVEAILIKFYYFCLHRSVVFKLSFCSCLRKLVLCCFNVRTSNNYVIRNEIWKDARSLSKSKLCGELTYKLSTTVTWLQTTTKELIKKSEEREMKYLPKIWSLRFIPNNYESTQRVILAQIIFLW